MIKIKIPVIYKALIKRLYLCNDNKRTIELQKARDILRYYKIDYDTTKWIFKDMQMYGLLNFINQRKLKLKGRKWIKKMDKKR